MENKHFVITLEQMNTIFQKLQDLPLRQGLPIVKILESLQAMPEPKPLTKEPQDGKSDEKAS